MIEIIEREVEGVRFIVDLKIQEPDFKVGGVGVHRVSQRFIGDSSCNPESWGLRKVGYDASWRAFEYAAKGYLLVKLIRVVNKAYWHTLRFLYDNVRMFKQIPGGEAFSWRYFTPYVWGGEFYESWQKGTQNVIWQN